jgi:hypothetical protein
MTSGRGWRWVAVTAGSWTVAAVTAASPAAGQTASGETAATALFDDAHKLMAQKRYAEACPKFAESERLAPSGGTLINLAECYEHTNQTASAWVAWRDAAARADAAGKADAEKHALARAAVLEATLAKLTIAVAPASDVPGLVVTRDGVDVGRAEFGVAIPVDPGRHVIEAKAPDKKPWSSSIDIPARQTDARITVSLDDEARAVAVAPPPAPPAPTAPPPQTPPASAPEGGTSNQKTIGIVVVAAGVVGAGLGSFFGLEAISKNNDALLPQNCPTSTKCTGAGLALTSDAKTFATASTVAFAVSAAAIVGGGALWLTAPSAGSREPSALQVAPALAPSYAGASLRGNW